MTTHWKKMLQTHWGISADLSQLDGEYDLNILAQSADQAYILKVMRPDCDASFIDLQIQAFDHIENTGQQIAMPAVIPALNGERMCEVKDEAGATRLLWVLEKCPGKTYAHFAPKSNALIHDLGQQLGKMDAALCSFDHPSLERDFKWNLTQANWIDGHIEAVQDAHRQTLISEISAEFAHIRPTLCELPTQALHNDVNDYNILATGGPNTPEKISGLIDLGDMCKAPRICDLAIAAAYIVLDHPQPEQALAALVSGYHDTNPLSPLEIDLLWPLLRARLAVSVVNSTLMAIENPNDPYIVISQGPAWRFLENTQIHPGLLKARLRAVCGLPVTDEAPEIMAFLEENRGHFANIMFEDVRNAPMGSLSVENSTWPQNPFHMPLKEAARVGAEFEDNGKIWLGYYSEPRLIYAEPAFRKGPWLASDRRTVHLAIDAFAPAGRPLYAPMDATVHVVENRRGHLDYGGVVILSHETPQGHTFYTLYGHLNPEVCKTLTPGQSIKKGDAFCRLGDPTQNGGWAPHVHFQLALTTDGMGEDWPGVSDPDEMYLWGAICPNPAALMNLPDEKAHYHPTDKEQILERRQKHFSKNLKLTYDDPVMFVRGWKHHLFDEWGRPYLDAYNNVPHVGHAHPRIQAVAADQLKRMNSNTRYLHKAQTEFAEKILSKLPAPFEVCFFVNSGTEANELALRLARAHTGAKAMITPNHGYHGNTTGAIDISAYKFNAPGGVGQPDWVKLVEVADEYRGSFKRSDPDRAEKYADLVDAAIVKIHSKNEKLAGFIAETFPSVGGQIIPPQGYLASVYEKIREAGGICIADEVQTGLGRLGDYYFAFEHQNAIPDIVVLGKPIGNGHPLGVLVTSREIADSFAQGPEYFSTFGGSTLSCRIGKEVLDIVDDEGLQKNSKIMGDRLLSGLRALQKKHACIGDVRGMGLFVGVELISNSKTQNEGTEIASYVKNRMRENRILMGTEGPKDNILKIRPPLTIAADDVDMILAIMDQTLSEIEIDQ
ncbi:aminotransferase class III-fold pyridoxal phosphate-dependent enzyme [Cochlodiniinecator piscidefendens]|uniref:aminotransferase class III-fold pyridoxal phosphate-dependent enzyme n=1 Tax=Cochlodiniinecator piscidefendens TaxID=2715756 RepID=UPI001409CD36|nr:aminotransferase class III-fold pyridoxal phosphate-dependent enzyme [Cochlodiniinecator piscidefendens]